MEQSVKERLITFLNHKGLSQRRFERLVGFSNGYLDKLRHAPSIEKTQIIIDVFPELNRTWLLTGEGEMLNDGKNEAGNTKAEQPEYETYLLPQSAIGGSLSGFPADGAFLNNCEKIISPIKGVDFAISVYGDSMAPEYPSGSRVLIKKINPEVFIDWGKVYVLDTSNGVIIKELHKNSKDNYVTCHSINPDPKFADFEVPISEVYGFYRVLMCMSAK